jgi:hypothetical protein
MQNEPNDNNEKFMSPYADEPTTASMNEKAPIKDLLTLLLIIPVLPFYIIYLVVRGKNKKFITAFFGVLALIVGLIFLGIKQYDIIKQKEAKVINTLDDYLGETEINHKEVEAQLKKQVSTLANSIDAKLLPEQLKPMYYIKQDMLTINYYHYLISAGYMGEHAEGAIYILQNALYSKNTELAKAAYESLALIDTDESLRIISVYNAQVEAAKKKNEETAAQPHEPKTAPAGSSAPSFINPAQGIDIMNSFDNFKHKLENVR